MKHSNHTSGGFRRSVGMMSVAGWVLANSAIEILAQSDPAPKAATEKEAPAGTAEAVEYNNWLELGVGSSFVSGDKAQFQQRRGLPSGTFGGVEAFHFEKSVGKKGLLSVDGRGIYDNHDYQLKLELTDPDKGFVRFGYNEFRTWYDGSGGYFPRGTNRWFDLYEDSLHIDRGQAWFEAGLRIPEIPEITFRYSHEFRDGRKDSTVWGDALVSGVPGPNNVRGIVPSFWAIDERRDIFSLDVKHTISKTDVGIGVRYESVNNDDSRNIHRRPGELTGSITAAADRFVTQRDKFKSDLWNGHAFTETRFSDQILFTTAYAFTRLDTDIGGSRIYGADYDPIYDPLFARRQQRDEGFLDLRGGAQMNQHVANLNFMWTPFETLTIVPSFRVERQDQEGEVSLTQTTVGAPPVRAATSENLLNTRQWNFTDVSEALELRYTGVTNWVFYVRGQWLEGQSDLKENQADNNPDDPVPPAFIILRHTDADRFTQKYVAGINWYPLHHLNLSSQYYHKIRQNDYTHLTDSTTNLPPSNNRYPAFLTDQDFETDDLNFRVTWHPLNNVTLVSRYDFQLSTVHTRAAFLSEVESAQMTTHILSQSISWVPFSRLFVQGSVNYVMDRMETPANDFVGSATNNIVPRSRNDYWNASLMAGVALDDKTDFTAQYFYYRANNYFDNSLYSQPYGADAEEHGVTASVSRQLTKNLRLTMRYGFFTNHEVTSGGHNDYTAHLVSSSLQLRF